MDAAPGWYSGVLCPMSVDATLGETPAWSSHVAAVWRASWSPIGSSPRSRHTRWTRRCNPPSCSIPDALRCRRSEALGVDQVALLELEQVGTVAVADRRRRDARRVDDLARTRDRDLQGTARLVGRAVGPQRLEDPLLRDRRAAMDEQEAHEPH